MAVTAGSVFNPDLQSDMYHARCKWTKARVDLWMSPAARSALPVEHRAYLLTRLLTRACPRAYLLTYLLYRTDRVR